MKPVPSSLWANFFNRQVKGFRKTNEKQGQGHCPFHDDHNPSLSLNLVDGLYNCHGCGASGNAIDFAKKKGLPPESLPGWEETSHRSALVATYPYKDESGTLLYEQTRWNPKAFRFRRPDGNGGWIWDLSGTRRVLYQLPALLAARGQDSMVFIVEGERDVETLASHGFTATTNPGGANNWQSEYASFLKDFDVVIIADKDVPGRAHAYKVAQALHGKVRTVRLLELPGQDVKDSTDWFNAGGTREKLKAMVLETNLWQPTNALDFPQSSSPNESGQCAIKFNPRTAPQLVSEKLPERVWVWERYIPRGGLVLLCGHPKAGKTTLVYFLIRAALTGKEFLGFKTTKSAVLVIAVEEHHEDISDRLIALGLDSTESLHVHCAPLRSSYAELAEIKAFVKSHNIGLVVIDTLARFWNVREENAAGEVGAEMQPILDLARTTDAAVLVVHHMRKSDGQDGSEIRGSGDLLAVADAGLVLKASNGSETQRTLIAYSRYPAPRELIIELTEGTYSVLGTKHHVRHEEQRKKVLRALTDAFLEAKTVAEAAELNESTCRTVLGQLFAAGLIDRQGEGVRGKAFSYALKSSAIIPQESNSLDCADLHKSDDSLETYPLLSSPNPVSESGDGQSDLFGDATVTRLPG